ncbi:MAG: CHAT domain-containing protein [Cryobacterium sp.]|nr:CHAT domain-containing protein [Cryobacterium sp.]
MLLPKDFASLLAQTYISNNRSPSLLELTPSSLTDLIPWELLTIEVQSKSAKPEILRLIEVADIVRSVPAGLHLERGRVAEPASDTGSALYVVDPFDQNTDIQLDAIFQGDDYSAFRERIETTGHPLSTVGAKFTRAHLSSALRSDDAPSRLVYVGHVLALPGSGAVTSLILTDPREMYGVSSSIASSNRPLSATDLIEGTVFSDKRVSALKAEEGLSSRLSIKWPGPAEEKLSGAALWPMPPRVLLIACNSGADMSNPEPFGLVVAAINAGARLVTASRWTLPTDRAFNEFGATASKPLLETSLALDAAHSSDDPVSSIADWQRGQLKRWLSDPDPLSASPILWAAFSNYLGDPRPVNTRGPERSMASEIQSSDQ